MVGRKYWVRHGNRWVQARITAIDNRLDIHTLADQDAHELAVNEIGTVQPIRELADDKEKMLQRTVEYAAQLQDSEAKFRAADRLFRGVWAAVTEQSVIGTDKEGLIDAWNPGATKLLGPSQADTRPL